MAIMKEGSQKYNEEAIELALSRVRILPCVDCGHPTIDGYCCSHCGSGNGTSDVIESFIRYKAIKSC